VISTSDGPRSSRLPRGDRRRRARRQPCEILDAGLHDIRNSTSDAAKLSTSGLLHLPRDHRPTAIFTGNNRCTVGALHAFNGRRRRIALVGFDDFELADLLGVTVIRTDPDRIGQLAASSRSPASTATIAGHGEWSCRPSWSFVGRARSRADPPRSAG
jgi:DNA-binding LacI/PurR family transcriptional regulator